MIKLTHLAVNRFMGFHSKNLLNSLGPTNIIMGPQGCGKSAFFSAFKLLKDCTQLPLAILVDTIIQYTNINALINGKPLEISFVYHSELLNKSLKYKVSIGIIYDERYPFIAEETLTPIGGNVRPVFSNVLGNVNIFGEKLVLATNQILAASVLSNLASYEILNELIKFIGSWQFFKLQVDYIRLPSIISRYKNLKLEGTNCANMWRLINSTQRKQIIKQMQLDWPTLETILEYAQGFNTCSVTFSDSRYSMPLTIDQISDTMALLFVYHLILNIVESGVIFFDNFDNNLRHLLLPDSEHKHQLVAYGNNIAAIKHYKPTIVKRIKCTEEQASVQ